MIQYPTEEREVHDGGVTVEVGDYVLIQMGVVVKVLSEEEAEIALKAWKI